MAPSVVIVGASGTVGRPLAQEFLKNKTGFGRIAVLADPTKVSRVTDVQTQGVEVVVGSFLEANSYKGFDTVISLTGNTAMKLQPGMIDAAIAGGVRHFYPSELGTDSYVAIGKRRYFRDKIATREHLRDRAREVPGFAYTLLMTGAFTEFVPSPFNNVDIENHTAGSYGVPDALISVTALPDIVRYVVESVLLPLEQGKSCRELRVAGETLTWATLIETLGEVQGVKYNVTYLDPQEAAEKEAARIAGDTEAEMLWAGRMLFSTGVAHLAGPLDNARFSFTPENAKETLQRLLGKK
ncbi:NAD(P)-binding protein [Mycena venus]|uniref:NAD(P)-binding protein n=1 Tax=Mycena venus TaxID=2733690 RepID=A0A8H6U351_9AGAR|nr:NAD(P)-binding protein [Mycena venus]